MCVSDEEKKKNLLKEALFGPFKLYCISLNVFSYFFKSVFFP